MKEKRMAKITSIFILIFFLTSSLIIAQDSSENISAGKKVKIFSKVLNEERQILISLPSGYEQSKKRYPVIYITDGAESRLIATGGMIKYLGYWEIPQMISVYIPNTNRDRDLSISKTPVEQFEDSGADGGVNFTKFLTQELISYIDNNYRTTDYRILVGYSLGGGFAINALLTAPEYFNAYIAASPHIEFEQELLDKTQQFFQSRKTLNRFLFIPYYEKDAKTISLVVPKIIKIIKENLPHGFKYEIKLYKGQGHIPSTAVMDGLLAVFKDWKHIKEPEIIPSNGFLKEGKTIKVEMKGEGSSIRYTLDGTEPTNESALYQEPIIISKPVTIIAKSFRDNLGESDATTAEFKNNPELLPQKEAKDLHPGLNYKYYERRWWILPNSIDIEPVKKGVVGTFSIGNRLKNEEFLFQFDGYLNITQEGAYLFYLLSTVRSKLLLGNVVLIENEFDKTWSDPLYDREEFSCEIYLTPGYYPIRVLYSNVCMYGDTFKISYEGPGFEKKEIPAEVLYHTNQ